MDKLIEALTIFKKYANNDYPTHCEHDVLYVVGIEKDDVSKEDTKKLNELGFAWDSDVDCWGSFLYGSA